MNTIDNAIVEHLKNVREMFDFDAIIGHFPGHNVCGHKLPTKKEHEKYLLLGLQKKIWKANKIWLLGKVAFNYITEEQVKHRLIYKHVLSTIHPSKRNYHRIMADKERIAEKIKAFIEL